MAISLNNQHLAGLKDNNDFNQIAHFLKTFTSFRLNRPSAIKNYHDLLLFYTAFPANKKILDLATSELQRIPGL